MNKSIASAVLLSLLFETTDAITGVDVSAYVSQWSCLRSSGFDFAIPRAWCSYGGADPNAVANVNNARAAGFDYVDVYMFPCRGLSASTQVSQMLSALGVTSSEIVSDGEEHGAKGMSAGLADFDDFEYQGEFESDFAKWRAANVVESSAENGANFGMVWIDVEDNPSSGCSWNSYSASSNCDYLSQLISAVKSHGRQVGVYTSEYEWENVMGSVSACTSASSVPLWYAHYDN